MAPSALPGRYETIDWRTFVQRVSQKDSQGPGPGHDITITFKFGDFFEFRICDWNRNARNCLWKRGIDSARHPSYLLFCFESTLSKTGYTHICECMRVVLQSAAWKMQRECIQRMVRKTKGIPTQFIYERTKNALHATSRRAADAIVWMTWARTHLHMLASAPIEHIVT